MRPSFFSFITSACAIIGGVFTVAGIVDSTVFRSAEVRPLVRLSSRNANMSGNNSLLLSHPLPFPFRVVMLII
jgi:hypothetical protein